MDQNIGDVTLAKLTAMLAGAPRIGNQTKGADAAADGQFQKLLEQRSKPVEKPAQRQNAEKSETPAEPGKDAIQGTAKQEPAAEDDAVQASEDPVEQVKKLAEQGCVIMQPTVPAVLPDGQVYQPGEYVIAWTGEESVIVPLAGVEPEALELMQLQQFVNGAGQQPDVSDPEADAMLEATDPTVDHSPAKLLEKVVNEQTGKVVEQAAEEVRPQQEDEDTQVEVLDVQQGGEQVFHEVKAAPIKVGESFEARQAQDVNEQIAAQVIPALEQGQTRVELQLTPEHLGTVKIEITQSENGSLHVAITAQSSQTRDLLEKHADGLQAMLATRAQAPVQVEVQRQEESQRQESPYDGHNGQGQPQQQEQHHPRQTRNSQDFLHQLRLGLVETEEQE